MATPSRHVPVEVLQYLTDFSTELDAALAVGGFEPWAARVGVVRPVTALRTTWPIPVSTAGYRRREGDDKMRALFQRFASMTTEEWYDGAYAQARILRDNPFSGWSREPQAMAVEYQRFPNILAADFLYRNPVLDLYGVDYPGGKVVSTVNMFSASHLVNVVDEGSDTWTNAWSTGAVEPYDWSGAIDRTLITALRRHFWELKAPNGQNAGYELAGFLVTTTYADDFLDLVARPFIPEIVQNAAGTENVAAVALENRFRALKVEVGQELTGTMLDGTSTGDADKIYALGMKTGGTPPPFIVAQGLTEEITYDQTDELYKNEGLIGIKRTAEFGVAGLIPHSMVRIDLSP